MTIDDMLERKRELGYTYEQIARLSGLPLATVQKVLGKITKSPRYDTVCALEKVLKKEEEYSPEKVGTVSGRQTAPYTYQSADCGSSMLRDPGIPYGRKKDEEPLPVNGGGLSGVAEAAPDYAGSRLIKENGQWDRQGEYTLEDYYALLGDKRVELIDGVFYDMASPGSIHQIVVSRIFMAFANYIDSNKGTCVPLISPMDVQIEKDDRTIVQPDVMIVCDREKFQNGIIYGAPDLVAEVLSKSTHSKDMIIKPNKYFNAGVREYWIVDPKNRQVIVYTFENGVELHVYDAKSIVPVGIFNGGCCVDIGEIFDYVNFLEDAE